jgi:hypothetical protein
MLRSFGLAGMMSLVLLSAPASAFDVVNDDYGGPVEPYAARLSLAEARGEPVRIGSVECDSSCTLFLAARRSCVSPQAVFGFHAPWIGAPNGGVVDPRLMAMFAHSYKPGLRRLFLAHVRNSGGAVPGPLMKISGQQLASLGYRLCGEEGSRQAAANQVRRTAHNRAGRINPSAQASSSEYPFARWIGLR